MAPHTHCLSDGARFRFIGATSVPPAAILAIEPRAKFRRWLAFPVDIVLFIYRAVFYYRDVRLMTYERVLDDASQRREGAADFRCACAYGYCLSIYSRNLMRAGHVGAHGERRARV